MAAVDYRARDGRLAEAEAPSTLSGARRQKFELLKHLAINLSQPIVLAGPAGIGKTHLLRLLEEGGRAAYCVCYIPSDSSTSYERILEALRRCASDEMAMDVRLPEFLTLCSRQRRVALLLIDDAAVLLPGLLNALWQFARQHPALRIVLAMRSDELRRKSQTDASALETAFVVRLPPLAVGECLALAREAGIRADEATLRDLHARSRGIPGTFLQLLAFPLAGKPAGATRVAWLLGLGTALILLVLGWVWRLEHGSEVPAVPANSLDKTALVPAPRRIIAPIREVNEASALPARIEPPEPVPAVPPLEAVPPEPEPPAVQTTEPPLQPSPDSPVQAEAAPPPAAPAAETDADLLKTQYADALLPELAENGLEGVRQILPPVTEAAPVAPPVPEGMPPEPDTEHGGTEVAISQPRSLAGPERKQDMAKAATPRPVKPEPATTASPQVDLAGLPSADWLLKQNPDSFTLQVFAVGSPEQLLKAARQFTPDSPLYVYRAHKGKGKIYILLYGIYPDESAARDAGLRLPPAFGRPFVRALKAIQQEIRRMSPKA